MINVIRIVGLGLAVAMLGACAQYDNRRGVLDNWQSIENANFVRGETSRQQVLTALGPPSQVVSLGDETAMYYLYEQSKGQGLVLVVYNRFRLDTQYDRAIFFFDANDTLSDFATQLATGSEP